ncbi:MAG: efflux RND transporter periplasmic adaptor subunit, partial [Proteobacteria bacterium]|nr:efflux RND transporter periplasmic adaptor subunit [Pseudomonadota bacterium]
MRSPFTLFSVLIFTAALFGCANFGGDNSDISDIRAYVHVEKVHQGTLDRTLRLTGTVDAGRTLDLIPDIAGEGVSLPVKVGEEVTKGQTLARIDLELALLQKKQAEAAVRLAELGHGTAEREFARAETLHRSGSL